MIKNVSATELLAVDELGRKSSKYNETAYVPVPPDVKVIVQVSCSSIVKKASLLLTICVEMKQYQSDVGSDMLLVSDSFYSTGHVKVHGQCLVSVTTG